MALIVRGARGVQGSGAPRGAPSWRLYARYTEARFDVFRDGGGPGVDYDGAALPFAPEWSLAATAEYAFGLGDWGGATLIAGYTYLGEHFTNPRNDPVEDHVDAYGLLDAQLRAQPRGADWSVALWVRNLTDKEYYTARDRSFLGTPRGIAGLPRTYGVTLAARF